MWYGGGGAGGTYGTPSVFATGGTGGGGNQAASASVNGANGAANTGGGGGGPAATGKIGGTGGTGIVVISFNAGLVGVDPGTTNVRNNVYYAPSGGTLAGSLGSTWTATGANVSNGTLAGGAGGLTITGTWNPYAGLSAGTANVQSTFTFAGSNGVATGAATANGTQMLAGYSVLGTSGSYVSALQPAVSAGYTYGVNGGSIGTLGANWTATSGSQGLGGLIFGGSLCTSYTGSQYINPSTALSPTGGTIQAFASGTLPTAGQILNSYAGGAVIGGTTLSGSYTYSGPAATLVFSNSTVTSGTTTLVGNTTDLHLGSGTLTSVSIASPGYQIENLALATVASGTSFGPGGNLHGTNTGQGFNWLGTTSGTSAATVAAMVTSGSAFDLLGASGTGTLTSGGTLDPGYILSPHVLTGSGTGTLTLPISGAVLSPTWGGPASFGYSGTGSIGTATLSSTAITIAGSGRYGLSGTGSLPAYSPPVQNQVLSPSDGGTAYGPNLSTSGSLTLPPPAKVQTGYQYGAGGDQYTGSLFPHFLSARIRQSDARGHRFFKHGR